ncbi:MAG: zf-HC2 domain-containing protein [Polaromonas sp.]|nr:zf-HC2 domain-containing protein [Polaromonas sp.]
MLKRTCREVAALLIAREDRSIAISDEVALKLHMLACDTCPKFENQILTMRAAMARWRNYANEDDDTLKPGSAETPE